MSVRTSLEPNRAPNKWGAMTAVGMSVFMSTLDVNIVNVSLPTLVEELDTDFATIQWVIIGYVLVLTSLTLSMARLGDMLGKRKLFAVGLAIFTLGSLSCGLAPNVKWLIGSRAFQGFGASITQALGAAIVTDVFPQAERGKALGIIGGIVSVGLAMGPAVGGILIGTLGWRSVFMVNIPIGLVAMFAAVRFIPSAVRSDSRERFDFLGASIIFVTLACYAIGMTLGQRRGFNYGPIPCLLFTAVLGLISFVFAEKHIKQPIVELNLFRNVLFSINLLMGVLVFVAISGNFVIPFFLELVKGYPPQTVGLLMMVVPVSMGLIAPPAGILSDRLGSRGISLLGLLIAVIGCLSISTLNEDVSLAGVVLRLTPFGIGMGLFQSPNNSAIMGAAPKDRLGLASGLLTLMRTLGSTSGIPLVGALFTTYVLSASTADPSISAITSAPAEALVAGLTGTYRVLAVVLFVSTGLAAAAFRIDKRRQTQPNMANKG